MILADPYDKPSQKTVGGSSLPRWGVACSWCKWPCGGAIYVHAARQLGWSLRFHISKALVFRGLRSTKLLVVFVLLGPEVVTSHISWSTLAIQKQKCLWHFNLQTFLLACFIVHHLPITPAVSTNIHQPTTASWFRYSLICSIPGGPASRFSICFCLMFTSKWGRLQRNFPGVDFTVD